MRMKTIRIYDEYSLNEVVQVLTTDLAETTGLICM